MKGERKVEQLKKDMEMVQKEAEKAAALSVKQADEIEQMKTTHQRVNRTSQQFNKMALSGAGEDARGFIYGTNG